MPKQVRIYNGSVGVNNRFPASRLGYDKDTGFASLENAVNFMIDESGAAYTADEPEVSLVGEWHSLFATKEMDYGIAIKERDGDAALYIIDVDSIGAATATGIRDGLSKGRKLDCYIIKGEEIRYSNGVEHGVVQHKISKLWPESEWTGTVSEDREKDTPAGEHIAFLSGIHYFSIGDVLHGTEPGLPGLYFPKRTFKRFDSRITMIIPAHDGLYVSTEKAIYFLAGLEMLRMESRKIADYPAMEWAKAHDMVMPYDIGIDSGLPCFAAGTSRGTELFMPSGNKIFLSKDVRLPDCTGKDGATLIINNRLIINSRGL